MRFRVDEPLLTRRLTGQRKRLILMKHVTLLHIGRFSTMFLSGGHESVPPESFRIHERRNGFRPFFMLRGDFRL